MFGNLGIVGWMDPGSGGSGPSGFTTINVDLTGGVTDIDLALYTGGMIINVRTTDLSNVINSFSNYAAITTIILRPDASLAPLTVNDGGAGGSIKLNTAALDIYGNLKGYLQLDARAGKMYQTDYVDQYAP